MAKYKPGLLCNSNSVEALHISNCIYIFLCIDDLSACVFILLYFTDCFNIHLCWHYMACCIYSELMKEKTKATVCNLQS